MSTALVKWFFNLADSNIIPVSIKCLKLSLKNLSLKSSLVRNILSYLKFQATISCSPNAKIIQHIPPDNSLPKYPRVLQPELVQEFGFILCILSQMINTKPLLNWEFRWQPEKTHTWKRKKMEVEEYASKIDF